MGFHNDRFCLGQLLVAPRINDASNKERDVVLVVVDVEQEGLVHLELTPRVRKFCYIRYCCYTFSVEYSIWANLGLFLIYLSQGIYNQCQYTFTIQ